MEAPGSQFRSVHVLRHTFRPNELLAQSLEHFTEEGYSSRSPRLLLTSTRAVAVDALDFMHHRYDLPIIARQKEFEAYTAGIALRSVGHRFDKNGDFYMQFHPSSSEEFTRVTDTIDTLEDVIERSDRKREQALILHLEAKKLVGRQALSEAWANLRQGFDHDSSNRLYTAVPYDISGPERSILRVAYEMPIDS